MIGIRREEQNKAADIGQYGVMIQLGLPSSVAKSANDPALKADLKAILEATKPDVVYTHNLFDKHDTHLGVAVAALQAMRELPPNARPSKVIGCELWRSLDWLPDDDKVVMDVSGHDHLAAALNGVFDSQIAGGKRYDLGTLGRRAANATFNQSHDTDTSNQIIFGMDLTPLVKSSALDIPEYALSFLKTFEADVRDKISRRAGG
jgi:LmbE family N-acetylglucosaminyl deacetylase